VTFAVALEAHDAHPPLPINVPHQRHRSHLDMRVGGILEQRAKISIRSGNSCEAK
jgi:hypothetical protein